LANSFKNLSIPSFSPYQLKLNQKHLNFTTCITPLDLAKPVPFLFLSTKVFLYNALYLLFFFLT